MPKPELGLKRVCVSCGTRFYDLTKMLAVCPNCGTVQPAEQPRVKRGGNVVEQRLPKKAVVAEEAGGETDMPDEEAEEGALEEADNLDDDAAGEELDVVPERDDTER